MSEIDWPLATMLAAMFVVMSLLRWRYFKRRMARARELEMAAETIETPTTKGTPS